MLLFPLLAAAAASAAAQLYPDPVGPLTPWQIHLAYGEDGAYSSMSVTWSTRQLPPGDPVVKLTAVASGTTQMFTGESTYFVASYGDEQWFHRVSLSPLTAGSEYSYTVGMNGGGNTSDAFTFKVPTEDTSAVFAVYGDMGLVNERSVGLLSQDAEAGRLTAILHVGDFAYNFQDNNGTKGDAFMQTIQPIAARVPYHTCPGNHEEADDFQQYRARFTMPGAGNEQNDNIYHSFDLGKVHVVMLSSEVFFYPDAHGLFLMPTMYKWLEEDLKAANANRDNVPFIITMAHRPMYCGPNDDEDACHFVTKNPVRTGIFGMYALEPLLYSNGVDIHFSAHEHSYSRAYPMYNYTWYDGEDPYTDYNRTTHIITGAAGCPELQDPWQKTQPAWSAFYANVYGFGRLEVFNGTNMQWSFVNDSDGSVIDSVQFQRHSFGPFPPLELGEE